jgi:hypothetical protein
VGGLVLKAWGSEGIFLLSAALITVWLVLAWPMKPAPANG